MEVEPPKTARRWLPMVLEGIVIAIVAGAVLYVAGLVVMAIWHGLLIVLKLLHPAPGG